MKKVLLITRPICPPWDEASKNFAYTLAKNVKDVEFGVLTYGRVPDLPENTRQHAIYTSASFSYLQKIRLVKNLRKIRKEYDILHYLFTPTKANSFLIKHFLNYKKTARSIQTIATLREDLYEDGEIKDLLFGDLIATYSDYAKNKLNELGFNNVKRVYPGIDLNLYSPAPKSRELRNNLNLDDTNFVIAYSGEYTRLGATEDIVNLILQYYKEFHEKNIRFIFACRIKNEKDLRKRKEIIKTFSKKGLLELVRFPKTFNSMEKMYNLSDIYLFPVQDMKGKFDIPLVVPEAMACEKPVILSDLPILSELNNGKNSVIIPRGDISALKGAILDLYNNPEKRRQIGKEARNFVEERFDIKKIAEIYGKIYARL
ncbi:MAG TPA: glycosyltransferase family 4 protein [Candidatus Moranbacteria bacterium]|nr:glycosyltransferase family 4 protein [Candidatus Moranbacteria bacterium]